jgi:signal peptidase II
MQKAGNPKPLWRNLIIPFTSLVIVAGDILTKEWIRSFPPDGATILKFGFIRFIHITNTGSAFGAFQGFSLVFIIVGIIGLFLLSWLGIFIYRHYPQFVNLPNRIALGLILGGDLGNLIDRLRFAGHVTDFIDPGFFAVFNVADSAITIGVILIVYFILRETLRTNKKA